MLLRALYGDDDVEQAVICARSALDAARDDVPDLEVVALSVLAFTLLLAGSDEADEVARETIVHPAAPLSPYGHVGALATRALAAASEERPRVASTFAERALSTPSTAGSRRVSPPRSRTSRSRWWRCWTSARSTPSARCGRR